MYILSNHIITGALFSRSTEIAFHHSPVHQNRHIRGGSDVARHYWNFDSNDLCNPITYIWYLHNGFLWELGRCIQLTSFLKCGVVNQYCITRGRNVDYFLTAILLRCFLASLDPIRIVSCLPCWIHTLIRQNMYIAHTVSYCKYNFTICMNNRYIDVRTCVHIIEVPAISNTQGMREKSECIWKLNNSIVYLTLPTQHNRIKCFSCHQTTMHKNLSKMEVAFL